MPRRPLRLRLLLPLVLAGLVAGAVVPVLVVSYVIASDSTARLVGRQADLVLDGVEAKMRRQIEPVEAQLALAREAAATGRVDPRDEQQWRAFMFGVLAGTPQVYGIGLVRPDGSMRRWERESLSEVDEPASNVPLGGAAIAEARAGRDAVWAPPFVSPVLDDAILNHRVAVRRDGELVGVLAAGIRASDVAAYLERVSERFGVTAFVLVGRERLFAYPAHEAVQRPGLDLPPIAQASDPVVRAVWSDPNALGSTRVSRSQGHWTRVNGVPYAYVYRELDGFGRVPLTIVAAIPSAATRWDRWAPMLAAGLGLVLAALAAGVAWWVGRRLARPVAALDGALARVEALEFDRVDLSDLRGAGVREWRSMAARIEQTAATLARFGTYVPRALASRLLAGERDAARPRAREVTVMFLDVEGFTPFAAEREAGEAAAFLARLFRIVGPAIEETGGVIDKYTGDGLLAFWGAPDEQPDHATRAVAAARAIERAVTPVWNGAPRLRVGLHSGEAIVGETGFPGRMDYTIAGRTVNAADRVQEALRRVAPGRTVVIGASEATLARLPEPPALDPAPRPHTETGVRLRVLAPAGETPAKAIAAAA